MPIRNATFGNVLWVAGLFAISGCLAVTVDLPVAYVFRDWELLRAIERPLQVAEPFGDIVGLGTVLLLILAFDRHCWGEFFRCAITPLLASGIALIPRIFLPRYRPMNWNFDASFRVADTFQVDPLEVSQMPHGIGFVSAEAAMAFALGLCLERRYPQGRLLFRGLMLAFVLQRLDVSSDFLSDLFLGASIGCLCVALSDGYTAAAGMSEDGENDTSTGQDFSMTANNSHAA